MSQGRERPDDNTHEDQRPPHRFRISSPEGNPVQSPTGMEEGRVRGQERAFGGATAPYPSQQAPASHVGASVEFTPEQVAQIGQIMRLGLEPVIQQINTRLDQLQLQQQTQMEAARVPVTPAAKARTSPSISSSGLSGFGEMPQVSPGPSFPKNVPPPPPLPSRVNETTQAVPNQELSEREREKDKEQVRDVFSKSDKWLPAMPTIEFSKWKSRQDEILGFADYVSSLKAWVSLGSDVFAWEIECCLSWTQEIHMSALKPQQQVRSARLLAILIQTFQNHPRASMLIQAYTEGVGVDGVFASLRGTSGFEALRLLATEFSLRSRAEASFFRAEVMQTTFKSTAGSATYVSDVVRQIDVALSRYRKLADTLPQGCSRDGLEIQSGDLTLMLLRSLPQEARSYVTLHAAGDSFQQYRAAALRYESQQRIFMELGKVTSYRGVNEVGDSSASDPWYDWYDSTEAYEWDDDSQQYVVAATTRDGKGKDKCHLCGKTGHYAKACTTDLTRVKCFKCGEMGHIGSNCGSKKSVSPKAKLAGKAKPSAKPKAGGKGGKKGKLNELAEGEGDQQMDENQEVDQGTVSGILMPVICAPLVGAMEVGSEEWCWWLIDSGAAVSVLSERYRGMYRIQQDEQSVQVNESYYAANGSPVKMSAQVFVSLSLEVLGPKGKPKTQSFKLACCVGGTQHNIVSTTQLVRKGWTIVQAPGEVYLWHEDSNTMITNVVMWGGCPWIKAKRPVQHGVAIRDKVGSSMEVENWEESQDPNSAQSMDVDISMIGTDLTSGEKLRQHILRGHYPFDPHCLECQQGRGVARAPRRSVRERILEVQVDFSPDSWKL